MDWLQRFQTREGFCSIGLQGLDLVKVDASVVCHDIRCPDLGKDEKAWFSICDIRLKGRGEKFAPCGELVHMKSLGFDTTLFVQTWAAASDPSGNNARRVCGEVKIPMSRLVQHCSSCLYHTWLLLDSPGLNDSIASVGMLETGNKKEGFDRALLNGPRQLNEHGVCLSIMKTSQLPSSGRPIWTEDMDSESKVSFWGSLLRSQQQHVIMCKAQSLLQNHKSLSESSVFANADLLSMLKQLGSPELVGEELRQGLEHDGQSEKSTAEMSQLRNRIAELESLSEANQSQQPRSQDNEDLERVRREFAEVSNEFNVKIEAANNRIRSTRKERDNAFEKAKHLEAELQSIQKHDARSEAVLERLKEENAKHVEMNAKHVEIQSQAKNKIETLENLLHSKTLDIAKQHDQLKSMENTVKIKQDQLTVAQSREGELRTKVASLETSQLMHCTFDGQQLQAASLEASQLLQASSDIDALKAKLDEVRFEANKKINTANDNIRAMKRERDDYKQEYELLKNQQAHLSASLEAQDGQSNAPSKALEADVRKLEERETQHLAEIQRLREQVQELEIQCQRSARTDLEQQRELSHLKSAFDNVCSEGKQQMGSMAEQVRHILWEREEFQKKAVVLGGENEQLKQQIAALEEEVAAISDQKDALVKIVDDINESCMRSNVPQLQELGRESILSVRAFRAATPPRSPRGTGGIPRNSMPRLSFG